MNNNQEMSEEQQICGFCKRGREVEDVCGTLWAAQETVAHQRCMQYSACLSQYKTTKFGGFKIPKVQEEIKRGRQTRCFICNGKKRKGKKIRGLSGATCGCAIDKCQRSYHYYCAKMSDTVITKRLEVRKDSGEKVVLYRVFCGNDHQQQYETKHKNKIDSVSHSDAEAGSDSEDHLHSMPSNNCTHSTSRPVMPVTPLKSHPTPSASKTRRSMSTSSSSGSSSPPRQAAPATARQHKPPRTARGLCRGGGHSSISDHLAHVDNNNSKNNISNNMIKRTLGTVMPLPREDVSEGQASSSLLEDEPMRKRNRRTSSSSAAAGKSDTSIDETKLRIQANPEDCMICFFERSSGGGAAGDGVAAMMQQMARELYGVPHSAVYIWQYSSHDSRDATLTHKHMLYFLKDISKALSQNRVDRLEQLVFDLSDADISDYSNLVQSHQDLGAELETKIIEKMRKQIHNNFMQAEALLKEDVGCMLRAEELSGNVMFLRVCQVIDPGHVIRSRLGHQADLIIWDETTTLADFSSDCCLQYQSHEKETLLKWLGKNVNSPQILTYPMEDIFISKNHHSTTYQLKRDYQKKASVSQSNNILVFLGPVDAALVNFDVYVRAMLQRLVEQRLSASHSPLYCVLDVGDCTGILSLADIMPAPLPPYADLTVWSAQNPDKLPVSAVLVKITFKTDITAPML